MISLDGAALIATVIPVAMLVVGFEIQRAPVIYATGRAGMAMLWVLGFVLAGGLFLGFWAEWYCITAVAASEPPSAVNSVIVWCALYLLGVGAMLLMLGSLLSKLGVLDKMSGRSEKWKSPRRAARMLKYIDEHHPSSRERD